MMANLGSARPRFHALCGGCQLVLPFPSFSHSQLHEDRSELRRCINCAAILRCSECEAALPFDDFSKAQQRKAPELRRCVYCVAAISPPTRSAVGAAYAGQPNRTPSTLAFAPSRRNAATGSRWGASAGLLREVCSGGGSQAFWRWAMCVRRVLVRLPAEVTPHVLACLGPDAPGGLQATGVAEIGPSAICAVCNVIWPRALQSAATHRAGRRHCQKVQAWRDARRAAAECAEAARAAGFAAEEVAAAATAAVLASAGSRSSDASEMEPVAVPRAGPVRRRWGLHRAGQ
mmetsp:Transcript_96835/g.278634  ORF Transcript_96835/g.278634 Transcript_96835/m.278634 type:complete len:289 (-) Transcript_96835:167-1033(-)